ncbi:MAG: PhoH family protein [Selenomonadaceae bacterium]|nr:PhoH family protein [Selenomonadaceae bacterium]
MPRFGAEPRQKEGSFSVDKEIGFRDRDEALAVLGERDEFINILSRAFACKIASRGDSVVLAGEDANRAAKVLDELKFLYRQGMKITAHEVNYAVELVKSGDVEQLHELFADTILVTAKGKHIRPKTLGQRDYLEVIRKNDITFGIGPAGTGKTYLAVVTAVAALRRKELSRIVLTRPAVEAGERLGFLPGDLQEKVDPYLRPLYDALSDILGSDLFQKFMSRNIIEIAPLAYMRGRTLEDAFIILDEAQNTTSNQMKMFLTRLGLNAKMVITGDLSQIDLPRGQKSGLDEAVHILKGIERIGVHEFESKDVIRNPVVARIVEAYEKYEG